MLFVSGEAAAGGLKLQLASVDGTRLQILASADAFGDYGFSPDGTRFLFMTLTRQAYGSTAGVLHLASTDGAMAVVLGENIATYQLSANGKRLAFLTAGNTPSTPSAMTVQVTDLTEGKTRAIVSGPNITLMGFSTAGDKLLFSSFDTSCSCDSQPRRSNELRSQTHHVCTHREGEPRNPFAGCQPGPGASRTSV